MGKSLSLSVVMMVVKEVVVVVVVVMVMVVVVLVVNRRHGHSVLTTAKMLNAADPSYLRQVCGGDGEMCVVVVGGGRNGCKPI